MANGTYGTKKPAFITSDDVDIFYHYRPNRNTDDTNFGNFKQIDSNILSPVTAENEGGTTIGTLPGMYNIKLPLDKFTNKGIYTIYIKPKEITTNIVDVSTLAAYPNIRGIVIDANTMINMNNSAILNNGGLVGFRVEYFNNGERLEDYRIITSNNYCEPITQNMTDSSQKGVRYRFRDNSNYIFCTLTPSTAMSFKSSDMPYIGETGQSIRLINTKFNPVMFEVELVDHDLETISTMLEGEQLRNLDNGLITTFNGNGEIYHQASYGHVINKNKGVNADFKVNNKTDVYTEEKIKMDDIKQNL